MQETSVSRQRVRPGRWLYAVAALVLILGVLSLVVLFRNVTGFAGDAIRVPAPGQSEITISESGKYVIAYEHRSVLDGKVITAPEEVPSMNVAVLTAETKAEVPVQASGADFTYASGQTAGRLIANFTVDRPGDYLLLCEYANQANEPQAVLAVGPDPAESFVLFLVVGVVGILLAFVIWLVTFVLRRNAKNRLRQSASGEGGAAISPT